MGLPLLLGAVLGVAAAGTEAAVEAGGAVHPGVPGFPSAWTDAWARTQAGGVTVEGYGQAAWRDGWANNLFLLRADGGSTNLSWTLGRQRLVLPSSPRVLDGGALSWSKGRLRLDAEAGIARAWRVQEGVGLARLGLTGDLGAVRLRAGLWGEVLAGGAEAQAHPELRVDVGEGDLRGSLNAMGATSAAGSTLELARAELRMHPASGVDLGVHLEHRQAPALMTALAPAILASFAPDGLEEAGLVLGWSGVRRSRATVGAALRTWEQDALGRRLGSAGSLALRLAGPSWTPQPSWRFATGPLGTVHVLQARSELPVPDALRLGVHAGVAPYLEPFAPWDLAWWTGLSAGLGGEAWSLRAGGDLGRSELTDFDRRAWLVLGWEP